VAAELKAAVFDGLSLTELSKNARSFGRSVRCRGIIPDISLINGDRISSGSLHVEIFQALETNVWYPRKDQNTYKHDQNCRYLDLCKQKKQLLFRISSWQSSYVIGCHHIGLVSISDVHDPVFYHKKYHTNANIGAYGKFYWRTYLIGFVVIDIGNVGTGTYCSHYRNTWTIHEQGSTFCLCVLVIRQTAFYLPS